MGSVRFPISVKSGVGVGARCFSDAAPCARRHHTQCLVPAAVDWPPSFYGLHKTSETPLAPAMDQPPAAPAAPLAPCCPGHAPLSALGIEAALAVVGWTGISCSMWPAGGDAFGHPIVSAPAGRDDPAFSAKLPAAHVLVAGGGATCACERTTGVRPGAAPGRAAPEAGSSISCHRRGPPRAVARCL